jgi:hypothetical protein
LKKHLSFLSTLILIAAQTKLLSAGNNSSVVNSLEYKKPPCLSQPFPSIKSESYKKGSEEARLALKKPYTSSEGVWNREILSKKSYLREAIKDFLEGKRGQSVLKIKLAGRKPEELHKELINQGFYHQRVPLSAYDNNNDKSRKFWRRDGTKTTNPNDPEVIPMDIYSHPDGGIIRIKSEGVPSSRYPRPQPSACKAVVYNTKSKKDKEGNGTPIDIRYRNEAFKVSDDGIPLPKGPSPKVGMRFPFERKDIDKMDNPKAARDELKGWISTIMEAAHISLAADFSHCPKQDASYHSLKTGEKASKS